MNLGSKILNSIVIIAFGGMAIKLVKTAQNHKNKKDLYDVEVVEDKQANKE